MAETKQNIELLKELVVESVDILEICIEKLSDGFQFKDVIPILLEVKDLNFLFGKWGEVVKEIKDLDNKEIEILVGLVIKELNLNNEKLKDFIVKLIDFIYSGYETFIAFKALKSSE